jgi:hypothetical protein
MAPRCADVNNEVSKAKAISVFAVGHRCWATVTCKIKEQAARRQLVLLEMHGWASADTANATCMGQPATTSHAKTMGPHEHESELIDAQVRRTDWQI